MIAVVVAGLALVGGLAYGAWMIHAADLAAQPLNTLGMFCSDLQRQDAASAYALFSPAAQHGISARTFELTMQIEDQLEGPITRCTLPHVDLSAGFTFDVATTRESFAVAIVRAGASASGPDAAPSPTTATSITARATTYRGVATMVNQSGGWRVMSLDAALLGSEVNPVVVTQQFCSALLAQDIPTAYQELAGGLQAQISLNALKAMFGTTDASKLSNCAPLLNTYTVASDDFTAQMMLTLSVQAGVPSASERASSAVTLHVVLALGKQPDHSWRITAVTLATAAPT